MIHPTEVPNDLQTARQAKLKPRRLSRHPAAERIDIDESGEVMGLS
jgi:formyltetrahydrofolate synthetase